MMNLPRPYFLGTPPNPSSHLGKAMTYLHRRTFLLALFAFASITFATARAETKAPVAKLDLADGDCVVFLGDSITHQRLYTQYVEDFLYTRFPKLRIKTHNAGVGGAQAWDALERFDRDVAAYKPKFVTVLLGMNDGRYQSYNEEIWKTYHDDMTTLVDRLVEIDATPILMTPTMYDSRAALARKRMPAENYNSVLAYYGTWLREVATKQGYGFVDMWGPLNNLTLAQRKTDPDFTMITDSVHPDAPGQLVMAYAIIEDMGLRGGISNIRVTVTPDGPAKLQGTGGSATDVEGENGTVAFTWTADSLPWVVPQAAQSAAKMLNLGHRASREAVEVHGLAPGKYDLLIDDQLVGTFTNVQLERHIELQSNDKTPQYQQASQIAELNQQRNSGPIGGLRGEWSQFQRFARTRRQAKSAPSDEKLSAQLAGLAKKVEGMEERIVEHERAAKEIEDQIFEINQPKPRRYVLKRAEQ
jgi:lysophospholipase L1-like esterase